MHALQLGCFPGISKSTSNCSMQLKPEVSNIQGIRLIKHFTYYEPSERWALRTSANKHTFIPSRHQCTKTKRQIQQLHERCGKFSCIIHRFYYLFANQLPFLPPICMQKKNILTFFKEEDLFLQHKIHFLNHPHLYTCIQNSTNLEFCHILDISWDTN